MKRWEHCAVTVPPHHLGLWPLPSHPNTRHCLGIHVTLTEETGAAPPPPHAWMAPLVEDMLHYGRPGLTEAVVTGPGRAVLFYVRQSMGQGLSLGKARDAAFTHTGAGTWVGKPAYPGTDPLTIQEGQQTITQAITECWTEVRGPGWPHSLLLIHNHLDSTGWEIFPDRPTLGMPVWTTSHHSTDHREARITINVEGTRDYYYLDYLHLLWIADSKAIGVQCWQSHQRHCSQTDWKAPGVPSMVDNVGKQEPHEDQFTHL